MIISFLYLTFNALFSCLLVSDEWAGYHKTRKTLRVSFPEGIQRSSYFISMPLRYGAPLTVSIALLHWTVSQSIFVVRVISHYSDGSLDSASTITAAGYSLLAIMICMLCSNLLLSLSLPVLGLVTSYASPRAPSTTKQSLTFPSSHHRLDPRLRPCTPRPEEITIRYASGVHLQCRDQRRLSPTAPGRRRGLQVPRPMGRGES